MAKIAVEKPFDDVKEALEAKGHQVDLVESDQEVKGYDVGVVRALSDGNNDLYDFPVISIDGQSIDEVVSRVEDHLQKLQ
ncbi:YkuS family protein [Paenibacillus kandeliae]|uniref:YkuS family protein n=1 Tax=Paenibacillus kandeliae TaxID=3231269 RepID=UPI00345B0BEA